MRQVGKETRTTWKTHVREIAEKLEIPVSPSEYVILMPSEESDNNINLTGWVDVVIVRPQQ